MDKQDELQKSDDNLEENTLLKYKINHLVSANKLKAYVRIEFEDRDKDTEVSVEDVLQYLENQSIVYGIREKEIEAYCKNKEYTKELIAACGIEPVHGKDAELLYDFDISKEIKFKEKEDGTIDFKNLNNVINVNSDDVLCHIIPAQKGLDGIDVYGKTVDYKKGRTVEFNMGDNTHISEDKLKLLASSDGSAEFSNGKVYVENVHQVNNVGTATGNIDFIGNVVINGDVKSGFSVSSKGNIIIKGLVEGAYIKSQGDVVISKGMNGMGRGSIYAKGNITSKYIENASIVSDKSVYAEALINSEVIAKDSIILTGSTSAIIGGTCQAENIISAKTIGSKTNIQTNIIIDLDKYEEELKAFVLKKKLKPLIDNELNIKSKELGELEEKIELITNSVLDNDNKNVLKKQLLLLKIKLNNEIQDLKKRTNEIIPNENIANHRIVCKGIMYVNTKITIGWMKYRVRNEISYSKIYNDGNDIVIVPLNPSDVD